QGEQALRSLNLPTLILWGAEDNLTPVSLAHRFAEVIPHAELIIYDNVGHIPMEEAADESAAAVRAFLARQPLARQP
ncbi:MAG: alpha/beta hydrolase, partial [Pseudomonadota bacterium]